MKITTERAEELASSLLAEKNGMYHVAGNTIRSLAKERDELKAKAIDFEIKRDVSVQTLENMKAERNCVQKALAAQCAETKRLHQQLAAAQAVSEKRKEAILQFRRQRILKNAHGIRRSEGYAAMQYAALDMPSDDTALRRHRPARNARKHLEPRSREAAGSGGGIRRAQFDVVRRIRRRNLRYAAGDRLCLS